MNENNSTKLIYALCWMFLAIGASAQINAQHTPQEPMACSMAVADKIEPACYIERMPLFTRCEVETNNYAINKKCSDTAILNFIYTKLTYPKEACVQGIEGTCVVGFRVDEEGSLSNYRLIRDIGGGCGKEALRIAKLLPNTGWVPATVNGKARVANYYIPIRFAL